MSKYKAILFDMDGTLLPMEQNIFVKGYFKMILGVLSTLGGDPQRIYKGFLEGIEAMKAADGKLKNKQIFWSVFEQYIDGDVNEYIRISDEFYLKEFEEAKKYTSENPYAVRAVELAHGEGRRVVLATNPVFPRQAQLARLMWVGLKEGDFDLITDYDTDSYTKPKREYYLSICDRLSLKPQECLMIGNDESDDMMGAESAGMDCFLVTDCLIPCDTYHFNGERGSFAELVKKLENC